MMTNVERNRIVEKLKGYIERMGSQKKAANSLKGISVGTLNHMVNGHWEEIKDAMWRHVGAQIGYSDRYWQGVKTADFEILNALLRDAQEHAGVFAVTGEAGTGKTYTLKAYAQAHKEVCLLACNEYWSRKHFLSELLMKLGKDPSGLTLADMMHEVVCALKSCEAPLILLDEADKLTDQALYFFITLYNHLEDRCGIALCATDHLEKRIKSGIKLNKRGYKEIFSRLGRRFVSLKGVGLSDVAQICEANDIEIGSLEGRKLVKELFEEAQGDLRRLRRKIHAIKGIRARELQLRD